jgi:2'-5' RNA ligase
MQLVSHWDRSSWHGGGPFYSWYLTFPHEPALHELAVRYHPAFAGAPLEPVPAPWLHLTIQSIARASVLTRADAEAIAEAARGRCAALSPFALVFDSAVVAPEAVLLLARPSEEMRALRATLRAAIADVCGPEAVLDAERSGRAPGGYVPHVTLAYSHGAAPAAPVADALRATGGGSLTTMVDTPRLLLVQRARPAYTWEEVAAVRLGSEAQA